MDEEGASGVFARVAAILTESPLARGRCGSIAISTQTRNIDSRMLWWNCQGEVGIGSQKSTLV
jgi:hypothetical protein